MNRQMIDHDIQYFDDENGISSTIHAVIPVGMRASSLDSQTMVALCDQVDDHNNHCVK